MAVPDPLTIRVDWALLPVRYRIFRTAVDASYKNSVAAAAALGRRKSSKAPAVHGYCCSMIVAYRLRDCVRTLVKVSSRRSRIGSQPGRVTSSRIRRSRSTESDRRSAVMLP